MFFLAIFLRFSEDYLKIVLIFQDRFCAEGIPKLVVSLNIE